MVHAVAAMAKSRRHYGPADIAAHDGLITGSWRPLIFRNTDLPDGQIDKAAFVLCALMHLHHALRRRDVFAEGSERWSDPQARYIGADAIHDGRIIYFAIKFTRDGPISNHAEMCILAAVGQKNLKNALNYIKCTSPNCRYCKQAMVTYEVNNNGNADDGDGAGGLRSVPELA
ncbi:hypothetical protein [Rhizohabitans arisaemae]|uniref:hypothetical protein n=1 Tax=Rhizohabitans arisaemae TaxID=2720610 RepID=UPI0024B18540|nr:hypothetical protein [Rhizohabitans arisaemae]